MTPRQVSAFTAHPWHGVSPGDSVPDVLTCYVELVSTDVVKYELDKATGLLRVDRPQRYSNVPPSLYGFVPRTYCAERVAARCSERTGRMVARGDGDPLDVCILTERPIGHPNLLVRAHPVGGLRLIDGDEADDKLVAVLEDDPAFHAVRELAELPPAIVTRLRHYFLTYKLSPDTGRSAIELAEVYDRAEAHEVVRRSLDDYRAHFAPPG